MVDKNECLLKAVKSNDIKTATVLIEQGANNFDECLRLYVFSQSKISPFDIFEGYNEDVVKLLLSHGADNVNHYMKLSCCYKNLPDSFYDLLIEYGANNFVECIMYSLHNGKGRRKRIEYFLGLCDNHNVNAYLLKAAKNQNVEGVELMIELGANDYFYAMKEAFSSAFCDSFYDNCGRYGYDGHEEEDKKHPSEIIARMMIECMKKE